MAKKKNDDLTVKNYLKILCFANFANFITIIRLIFSIWLVILIIFSNQLFLMFILVILCGLTDVADGWVARRYNIASRIGALLDRLADKIFICPTIIVLAWRYLSSIEINFLLKFLTQSLVGIIVFLELILIVSAVFSALKGIDTSSNIWGKRKMVFQSAAVFLWFFTLVIEKYSKIKIFFFSAYFLDIVLIIVIYLAIKSLGGYWKRYREAIKFV